VTYVLRRLFQTVPVLFLASIPVFLIMRLAEGDPVMMLLGVEATRETILAMRERLGLDQPLWRQYWAWITGALAGDLGRSVMSDFTVAELLRQRLPATFMLAVVAVSVGSVVAFPVGIVAALRRGGWFDAIVTAATSIAISIPHFWLGILLVLLFALKLGWLPAGGYVAPTADPVGYLRLVALPAVTLALYIAAILVRFARASMSEVLHQDYVRTARGKGLTQRVVVLKHALRNALIPAVTVLGVQFGRLMAGTIIVEVIFAWPGLGQLILGAIHNRDYPVVQGTLLLFIVLVVVSNLVTDLLYSVIDPRITLGSPR
jgi:ABC-type dipeptide/oligopeptide/nickel transport system permease component